MNSRPHPSPIVQEASEQIADHMDSILAFFKKGALITVLVRQPSTPDGSRDFVLTNDKMDDAIAALERRKNPHETLTGAV